MLDDAQFAQLLATARPESKSFAGPDGAISFEMPALIVTADKA
jgi:hypothetical protein